MFQLGLALSGGGSRAAAFHRGTVMGLAEIGLVDQLDVLSTVSGGSIFAAAWMAARWKGNGLDEFLTAMGAELAQGFIARSIGPRIAKLLRPSYTRADLLAETFDNIFIHRMRLKDLPDRPLLCMNVSVMNTGQVGKFSRDGFSSTGLRPIADGANQPFPLSDFPVALAATASAAFPVGLPPVYLYLDEHLPTGWSTPMPGALRTLALTDGGVLENLGVQTLLQGKRFGAQDIIISDAGRREEQWSPGGVMNRLRGAIMSLLSMPIIERVTLMMNDKENRQMRSIAFREVERSWLVAALRSGPQPVPGMDDFLLSEPIGPRRRVLFIRLVQTLDHFLTGIPPWRLRELATRAGMVLPDPLPPMRELLSTLGVDLRSALQIHEGLGGDARIVKIGQIETSFSALNGQDIQALFDHARWQVHAAHALYWN